MRSSRFATKFYLAPMSLVLAAFFFPAPSLAATQPQLGTALNFTAMAGTTITNTGPTVITGSMALSPGSAVTGFPPGVYTGSLHVADASAVQAQSDLTAAYVQAASAPSTSNLTGKDLGGLTLTPGVYTFSSSAALTGVLTLSGNGVYIFQTGSTLITANSASVVLENGAQACAVYWQVGSSATLGNLTTFEGNIMAQTSITMNTGANILDGRALARNGALTLDDNQITAPQGTCSTPLAATPTATPVVTPTPTATPATPAPTAKPQPISNVPSTGIDPARSILPGLLIALLGMGAMVAIARPSARRQK